jgi:hypothetical protein
MKAAELSNDLTAGCRTLAWDQWAQLGLSGFAPDLREERAADPEALLLFSFEVARYDPRLFDEVMDWLRVNQPLVSVQRLRNLCSDPTDTALTEAALDWTHRARKRPAPPGPAKPAAHIVPLFLTMSSHFGDLDESFARHGFARAPIRASGKSQPPRLLEPISFALRLRRLLGIGVRAEIVRSLLTIRAPRLSGRTITAEAAFAQRNVREGLTQLVEAGVISAATISDDRQYAIGHAEWAALLGLPAAPDLPFHFDWIPTLRALTQILRWLQQPDLDELTPYMRASESRRLVKTLEADLRNAGVPLGLYTSLGPEFWNDFTAIVLLLLRKAQGQA